MMDALRFLYHIPGNVKCVSVGLVYIILQDLHPQYELPIWTYFCNPLLYYVLDFYCLAVLQCVRCVITVSVTQGLRRTLAGSSAVCSLCRRGVYCTRSQTYTVFQLCGVFAVSTALSHRCSLPGSSAVCWVVSATLGHRRTLPGSSALWLLTVCVCLSVYFHWISRTTVALHCTGLGLLGGINRNYS